MRKKNILLKGALAGIGLVALLAAGVWLDPTRVVWGRLQGEAFFEGRPSSYWRNQLSSADPSQHGEALARLEGGGENAADVLAELTSHHGPAANHAEIRSTTAEMLGKIRPPAKQAAPALLAALEDPDPHVRDVAAKSLVEVDPDSEEAVQGLMALLDTDQRRTAARSLSYYGPQAKPALEKLVDIMMDKNENTETRWNAARTLGKMRASGAPAVPQLIECLQDQENTVREHAAEALGDIGPAAQSGVDALIEVLDDPAIRVRRDAARSLGQVGPAAKKAIPHLRKLLKDPQEMVRTAAKKTLESLGEKTEEEKSEKPKTEEEKSEKDTVGKVILNEFDRSRAVVSL